jgi:hypothetical protein
MLARADRCCPLPAHLRPALKCVTVAGRNNRAIHFVGQSQTPGGERYRLARRRRGRLCCRPKIDRPEDRERRPGTCRMRADRHYVDQLAAPVGGHPVRMLPVDQVDSEGSFSQTECAS